MRLGRVEFHIVWRAPLETNNNIVPDNIAPPYSYGLLLAVTYSAEFHIYISLAFLSIQLHQETDNDSRSNNMGCSLLDLESLSFVPW